MRDQEIVGLWEAYQQVHSQVEEVEQLDEASYSAKAARAGKDIGNPGKEFAKIAKEAGERYGSEERGKKVAGAVLAKLRAEETDLFDYILEHLVAEGYADTNEAALVIMANMSEDWRQSIVEAEVLAQKGGVAGSVKVKPALNIPGTSIGVGPNRPVPGTFTTTTPEQRQKISQGDTTIDRGIYKQSRVGAGPTANERQRYNTQLTLSRTPGKLMSQ